MWTLNDTRALVCGSSQGIGRASAEMLARSGASITLLARNPETLADACAALPTPAGQQHAWLAADFADPTEVERVVGRAIADGAQFDILINNTGGPPGGLAIDAEPADFERAFRMHLINNQTLARLVVPQMRERHFGRIVNIISTSVKAPIPGLGVSNTIRGAVASWAKTLATELAPHGITVNNVLPGFTDTARLTSLFEAKAAKSGRTFEDVQGEAIASIPAARLGTADEIAAAVTFLASREAAYVNGINLPVDGGRTPTL